ncbi:MAG: Hsp33 family molecular chaperone [Rhizobiaceae bacterium]|nr:Hsp33 family molecular chaperone [Rhizobiaceae bacterium]
MNMSEATLNIDFAGQDAVIPFQVNPLDVRGRSVQLGPMLDSILERHAYPEPVSRLLAEAITLTVLLGTALKFEGKFILQTQTDGPVSMIVTDFTTPGSVRAYARYDEQTLNQLGETDTATLLGRGSLAMTIDQGVHTQRYQGIVQLDGTSLEDVARQYFRQSEQIPTDIRLAVGEVLTRREGQTPKHAWTAGGILVQFLPDTEERMRQRDLHGGDGDGDDSFEEDEVWTETKFLMKTIDDIELTDSTVEPEKLLFRLFNEHGVRVYDSQKVQDNCSCSEQKVTDMLEGLSADERQESVEQGDIHVKCEFCSQSYSFDPALFA